MMEFLLRFRYQFDRARRHLEERLDQAWALAWHKIALHPSCLAFDGNPRFALITVNFSTTRYLKLMLLTLAEQSAPHSLSRIVIVDNHSRDGGLPFLRKLAQRVDIVSLVENRFFLNHARGMRSGLAQLERN